MGMRRRGRRTVQLLAGGGPGGAALLEADLGEDRADDLLDRARDRVELARGRGGLLGEEGPASAMSGGSWDGRELERGGRTAVLVVVMMDSREVEG